ncbi:MAG TPA: PHB depolymerase family esterase [Rhodanobacteraceae bacterium]|nr:PHB depolymerase family esterase [Rhodanobacteraceae bacterium]
MARLAALVLVFAGLAACAKEPVESLPTLKVDAARIAVAGLSSGAYMATQTHLAWPELFVGAALVAGGPYGCAGGKLETALGACMKGAPAVDIGLLAQRVRQRASDGALGALRGLAGDRVYVLHGQADGLVAEAVSRAAVDLYRRLQVGDTDLAEMKIDWDGQRDFAHNLPLAAKGDDCQRSDPPYLGHCGFDAAGAIFAKLYGKATAPLATATGELRQFDQNALLGDVKDAYLADTGYVYLPRACLDGKPCGVLVAFHGCKQNADSVGEAFVRDAGFNRWADAYRVAVLYPQTRASFAPLNPQACWDWWGYSGSNYDTRQGVQQQWLMHALAALGVAAR